MRVVNIQVAAIRVSLHCSKYNAQSYVSVTSQLTWETYINTEFSYVNKVWVLPTASSGVCQFGFFMKRILKTSIQKSFCA